MNPAETVRPVIEFVSLGSRFGVDAGGRLLFQTRGLWERLPSNGGDLQRDALAATVSELMALRRQLFNLQEILNDMDPNFYGESLPDGLEDMHEDYEEDGL